MANDADAFMYEGYGDDPELAYAIKMSMIEEETRKIVVPNEPTEEDNPADIFTI